MCQFHACTGVNIIRIKWFKGENFATIKFSLNPFLGIAEVFESQKEHFVHKLKSILFDGKDC